MATLTERPLLWPSLNWLPGHWRTTAADAALAAACFALVSLPVLTGAASGHGSMAQQAILGVLAVLPIVVRRRFPAAATIAVAAVLGFAALIDVRFTPWVSNAGPAFGVVVYTLALTSPRRREAFMGVGAVLLVTVLTAMAWAMHPHQDQDAVQLLLAVPAWLAGRLVRSRRDYQQAWQDEVRRREDEREARIRAEERLRVSRDVHDVVSHTLSMIAVQSGVARVLLDQRPTEAAGALSSIEHASRSALLELRRVLTQLRSSAGPDEPVEPSLADLPTLLAGVTASALDVQYRIVGDQRSYPPLVETAVYRIAQEALTNVVKHSRATRAELLVSHGVDAVAVSVVDDGAGPPAGWSAGFGLTGMQERAELVGGTFEYGPVDGNGFAVRAVLPVARGAAGD